MYLLMVIANLVVTYYCRKFDPHLVHQNFGFRPKIKQNLVNIYNTKKNE